MARRVTEAVPEDVVPVDVPLDPSAAHHSTPRRCAMRTVCTGPGARHGSSTGGESKRAGIRFWLALILLLVASVAIAVTIWHEVQQLFGL